MMMTKRVYAVLEANVVKPRGKSVGDHPLNPFDFHPFRRWAHGSLYSTSPEGFETVVGRVVVA